MCGGKEGRKEGQVRKKRKGAEGRKKERKEVRKGVEGRKEGRSQKEERRGGRKYPGRNTGGMVRKEGRKGPKGIKDERGSCFTSSKTLAKVALVPKGSSCCYKEGRKEGRKGGT